MAGRCYLGLTLIPALGFPGCAAGTRQIEPVEPARVILVREYDPAAIWRFIPLDVLPGGLDAEPVELVPPPPPPAKPRG